MSMHRCKCGKIYDTDFQMEVDENGDCICDACYEKKDICVNCQNTHSCSEHHWYPKNKVYTKSIECEFYKEV